MEKLFYQSSIFIHVIAGVIALLSGIVAMITRKVAGQWHSRSGLVYYWSMVIIFFTNIVFFVLDPLNLKYQFFLTISMISIYPTWSGRRMLSMKKAILPRWYDKAAAIGIGISGLIMCGYAVYGFQHAAEFNGLQYLFLIFGGVSLGNAYGDIKIYFGFQEPQKLHWLLAHGGKMMGAYSATATAFCVNVVPRYLPQNTPSFVLILTWVLPGVLFGGILSNVLLRKYRQKSVKKMSTPQSTVAIG